MNKTIRALIILLLPLSSMGALTVNNGGGATNITSTSAWITATVVSTGAANPYLYSYWGTNDGGTNAASWEHTNVFWEVTQTAYSVQITGLSSSTIYYFRAHATNSSESAWALNTAQFITLTMPTSAPPSSVRMVSVNTNAELRSPMNFFAVNSNMIKNAIGYSDITDTNAVWGNITGSLADQLDLQSALDAKAATSDMMQIQSAIGDLQSATNVLDSAVSELAGQTNTFIQAAADAASATNSIAVHIADTANPHAVTAEQTGAVPTNDPAYLAAMTNFLPADSASNYLAYDPDTRTLSGCVTNIGAGSAYDDSDLRAATNALDIRVSVLESPYQPWVVLNPGDGETCTVTFAHGSLVSITATNGLTTIGFDNDSGYPVAGVSRVGIELWAGTNEIAFDSATITNATTPVIATDAWTSLFFRRTSSNVLWEGRQYISGGGGGGGAATGGWVTNYSISGTNYQAHIYTNIGTTNFVVSDDSLNCDVLIVAGGGGGGGRGGGGGGAGEVIITNFLLSGESVVIIGYGGDGGTSSERGTNGADSAVGGVVALGGGGGGSRYGEWSELHNGTDGGSGGGGNYDSLNGTGDYGWGGGAIPNHGCGNSGGNGFWEGYGSTEWSGGGGGGGAGTAGTNAYFVEEDSISVPGHGGDGIACDFSGIITFYGGGGGGGLTGEADSNHPTNGPALGGLGGGGNGGNGGYSWGWRQAEHGIPNTGGGGGGEGHNEGTLPPSGYDEGTGAGNGGSGIVIIRFKNEP